MNLNHSQLLLLLKTEKISDDNTGVYTIHFDKLLEKLSFSDIEKDNILQEYNNERLYTEKAHIEKVAKVLDNKIEVFSDDFYELFFFRKHAYSHQYSQRSFYEFNESYEDVKVVKKRVKVLKELNITYDILEKFLERLTYKQDGYIDLWFNLNKKTKNSHISKFMKSTILNYGSIDKNESKKAVMLGHFGLVEELKELYENNKNSEYRKDIEHELGKYQKVELTDMNLFEENNYHSIIYRKVIPVNKNALLYNLNIDKTALEKIVNVINQFLHKEIYNLTYQKQEHQYVYTIECYAESQLKEVEEKIKKSLIHLPLLLRKNEYDNLLKEDAFINEEIQQFFQQYIKSAEMYKNFNEKMPEKKQQEKKNKI